MANKANLDSIYTDHPEHAEETGFELALLKYKELEILKYATGKRLLDIGCGVGILTSRLAKHFDQVVGLDGSKLKIHIAEEKYRPHNVNYIQQLFEEYKPDELFDTIVMTNVVEHLEDPGTFLTNIKSWLTDTGVIIATVPHALAFHKQLGKAMGLIDDYYALTKADLEKGHTKNYDREKLMYDFEQAEYEVVTCHGFFLKPFSSAQIEKISDLKMLDGLYEMGKQYPDLCSSLIIVTKKDKAIS